MKAKTSLTPAVLLLTALAVAACGKSESPAPEAAKNSEAAEAPAKEGKDHKEGAEEGKEHAEEGHEEKGHGEAGHEEEEGSVKLSAEQIKAAGIVLATAGPTSIRESLPLYGVITPNAERVLQVSARFPGAIQSVTKKIGDSVKKGESLAVIESNESLRSYALISPLSGVVTERSANPGAQAGAESLFTVADLSTVWVELSLFPRDVSKVRVGQNVRVKGTDTALSADGKVVYVAPFGSAANQTLSARVLLDNSERRWSPGLNVTAEVTLAETAVPLAISSSAVQNLEGRDVVFVQHEEGFEPKPVKLGRTDGDQTEVLEGLAAGDRYAAANSFILKAELGKGSAEHGH